MPHSLVTKTRYREFEQGLLGMPLEPGVREDILFKFQAVFHFDPNRSMYDPQKAKATYNRLQTKAQAEGTTVYVLQGRHKYYEQHRDDLKNKRRDSYARKRSAEQVAE